MYFSIVSNNFIKTIEFPKFKDVFLNFETNGYGEVTVLSVPRVLNFDVRGVTLHHACRLFNINLNVSKWKSMFSILMT